MRKPKYVMNYKEGYVFAVPLDAGGYVMGVAARLSKKPGGILGYFFGPRIMAPLAIEDCSSFKADKAIWVKIFGDLGLVRGEWPILGPLQNWERDEWPIPIFGMQDDFRPHLGYRHQRSQEDIHIYIEMKLVPIDEIKGFWKSGTAGSGYVATVLSNALPEYGVMPKEKIGLVTAFQPSKTLKLT